MSKEHPYEVYKALKKLPDHQFDALPVEVHTKSGKLKVLSVYLHKGKLVVDVE